MNTTTEVLVADECWIALALLHRIQPERSSFSARELLDKVRMEKVNPEFRAGVQPHIYLHNVANVAPNSARYRLFYRLEDGTFRLFKPGDDFHTDRKGKTKPDRLDLPPQYHELLDWYEREYCARNIPREVDDDLVLEMRGIGQEIWTDTTADAFVATLRSGWSPGEGRSDNLGDQVWGRIVSHQKELFHTVTRLPFTYTIEGESGLWFYRNSKRVNRKLWRGEIQEAIARCPLENTTTISDLQDSSYLYGVLMDNRIRGNDW